MNDSDSGNTPAASLSMREYVLVNMSKGLSELIGTALISYYLYANRGDLSFILFCYWLVTLFACEISGAHFNPAITLAQMFRSRSNFGQRRLKGVLYIAF